MRDFDVPDKNAQKYVCFVCARQYLDFDEFKSHIKSEHEEGRDYVICPLERCGAPVRDVRLHFKVRHPRETVPAKGMMKAIVWRDLKDGKMKGRKPKVREGHYDSVKAGATFHYRSGWEENVYQLLDEDKDVLTYGAEPFKIEYIFEGESHHYIPDILVSFVDGHKELWEIKPSNQTALAKNQAKWFYAEQQCLVRGWKFVVVTEQVINQLKTKVSRQRPS